MKHRLQMLLPLVAGLLILSIFLAFALWPQAIAPYNPQQMFRPWQSMGGAHPLGTNDMGYDLLSELVFAARSTLTVGLAAAAVSLGLGTLIGLLSGWLQGFWGEALDMAINVFLLVPMLPAAIVISAILQQGNGSLILVIGLLGWCGTARAVRAEAQRLRCSDFVHSLCLLDIPPWRILLLHLLPNLSQVVFSRFVLSVSACIMTEATLSFLGLGDPTRPSWGGMISMAYQRGGFARGAAHWFLAPGLCIMLTTLAFGMIGRYFEQRGRMVEGGLKD